MSKPILTQERLKELLSYDPETGVFVWVVKPSKRTKIGSVAGSFRLDGYRQIQIDGAQFRAHRLAWFYMTREFPPDEIDHINRDRADNRFVNLRAVTGSENQHNSGKPKDNTSGYRGVSYDKRDKKWRASIRLNNVLKNLGYFPTPEEANVAYLAAQRIYHPTCPTI
jgi:hypothetical protein